MKRRLEPELMDDAAQALAYAEADFSESNTLFLELLKQLRPGDLHGARALDLGCGPADISIRFLRAYPKATCDALDGAQAMLDLAQKALDGLPGVAPRCRLIRDSIPSTQIPSAHYDLILSNSLLHHLHDPQVLWRGIQEAAKPGALVLVMDLMRPASAGWAEALVATYANGAPEVLRTDFRHSLFAAFEPQEVVVQLAEAGLTALEVAVVSDRHLAVSGRLTGAASDGVDGPVLSGVEA
ncbi:class I SAM-dependent methyltransferase [uncultured Thiocystis sp.]|uniref:class I SAM-dependent methyltransferase n=1 Tax=uncultured Thiocystis sp. TaxID=1202134 RepID=UPI0025E0073D|nr:class I SAM-dependent methyltransferase [uncultured Thiocystis sp.]